VSFGVGQKKMVNSSEDLGVVLKSAARRYCVECGFNTHFEALNWELSWWGGQVRHRLDFQPVGVHGFAVTHYRDTYPRWPRFLRWARDHIPYVPSMARVEFEELHRMAMPAEEKKVMEIVDSVISVTKEEPRR